MAATNTLIFYIIVKNTIRGCKVDMTESLKLKCKKYDKFCKECTGENCNKDKASVHKGKKNKIYLTYIYLYIWNFIQMQF